MKPILITSDPAIASWLRDCLASMSVPTQQPLHVVGGEGPFSWDAYGDVNVLFVDLPRPGETEQRLSQIQSGAPAGVTIVALVPAGAEDDALAHGAHDYLLRGQADANLLARVLRYAQKRNDLAEDLASSEAQRLAVSELISDFVYALDVDPDGEIVLTWATGTTLARTTGYPFAQLAEMPSWKDIVHPRDAAFVAHHLQELVSGRATTGRFRIVTRDGNVRWLHNYGWPLWDEAQQRVTRIYGAAKDITRQQRTARALRHSDRRFQLLLENLPDTVFIFDLTKNKSLYFNRDHFLGYTREELRSPNSIAHAVHTDDAEAVRDHWRDLRNARQGDVRVVEYRLRRKSGPWEWLRSRETVLDADEAGRAARVLVALSVVTERKERERALQEYAQRLEALHKEAKQHAAAMEERTRRLMLLNELSLNINRPIELDAVLDVASQGLVVMAGIRSTGIALLNPAGDALELVSIGRRPGEELPQAEMPTQISLGDGDLARYARTGREPYRITADTAGADPILGALFDVFGSWSFRPLAIVPLVSQGENIGLIGYESISRAHSPSEEEMGLLQTVANLVAAKVGQIRLFEATRRQLEELKVLHAVATAGAEATDEEDLLERATQIIGRTLYPDNFGVLLLDETTDTLHAHASYRRRNPTYEGRPVPLGQGVSGQVALSGRAQRIADVSAITDYISADPETRSELCVPLKAGDRILGVVNAESTRHNAFSEDDERLLVTFAGTLTTALEKLRLLAVERRRRQEAEIIRDATTAVTATLDLEQVLERILVFLKDVVPYDSAEVFLRRDGYLWVAASTGRRAPVDFVGKYFPIDSLFRWMERQGSPIYLRDARVEPEFKGWGDTGHVRGWMGVPLMADGDVIGCLTINSEQKGAFDDTDALLAQTFANQAAAAVKNASLFEATQASSRNLELMSKILRGLNATPDVRRAFPTVVAGLRQITDCYHASLTLLDEEKEAFYFLAMDQPVATEDRSTVYPVTSTPAAADVLAGRVHITPDLAEEQDGLVEKRLYEMGQRSRLNLPLLVGEEVIGSLNLTWDVPAGYRDDEIPLLQQIAAAVALALERSRLFEQTQASLAETQALYHVSRTLIAADTLSDLLQRLVNSVAVTLPADGVLLLLLDLKARQMVDYVTGGDIAGRFSPPSFSELEEGLTGWVLRERKPTLSPKGVSDPRESAHVQKQRQANESGAIIVAPLQYRDKLLGTVTAINRVDGQDFTEQNVDLLVTMANQAAVAIENSRLFEETRRHVMELETLADISASLRAAESAEEIVKSTLSRSLALFAAETGVIVVPGEEPDTLVLAHEVGIIPTMKGLVYRPGNSIFGHVYTTGRPYLAPDVSKDPRAHRPSLAKWREVDLLPAGAMYAPLRASETTVGIISISKAAPDAFDDADLQLLTAIADITGSALQRAQVLETLEQRVMERTQELAEANEQLKELDRLKSKFVSDVSHELRMPITNLALYLDLIEQGKPEKREQYWHVLREQTNRLTQLIEDILSLSRLELDRVKTVFEPVDLNALVAEVVARQAADAEASGLALSFVPGTDLPPVRGMPEQLEKMVMNVVDNAVNYTPAGAVTATTFFDDARHQVALRVEDTGVGISDEDMPHLFERFYRGRDAAQSNIPGTGLGLTILQEVVKLHEGDVLVESATGEGTIFTVWLPTAGGEKREEG